jgi:hypothetical protein
MPLSTFFVDEYYDFQVNDDFFSYTSKVFDSFFDLGNGSKLYKHENISRSNIKITDNVLKNTVTITLPVTNNFARSLLSFFPTTPVNVIIGTQRQGLSTWIGVVNAAKCKDNTIQLECISSYGSTTRPAIIKRVQISCPHRVYDNGCRLIKSNFKVEGLIDDSTQANSVIHVNLYYSAHPVDLTNVLAYLDSAEVNYNKQISSIRYISYGGGTSYTITLTTSLYPVNQNLANSVVTFYPSCDLKKTTCTTKFNNFNNFGGFSYMPKVSPYDRKGLL